MIFQNDFYVLGGFKFKTQLSKVSSCKLELLGQLPFEFSYGACTVANNAVYLCFGYSDDKLCRFTGRDFTFLSEIPCGQR